MGRWLGGVFGNTKLATDVTTDVTGRYTISDHYYMVQEGGWVITPIELVVEAWGAGGGGGTAGGWTYGCPGGSGGYTKATLKVPGDYRGTNLKVVVGGGGQVNAATGVRTYGGGGGNSIVSTDNRYASQGGGMAAVFLNNTQSAPNCLVVAGGGGGGGSSRADNGNTGGGGGGLTGNDGSNPHSPSVYTGPGGTQSAAGVNPQGSGRPASYKAGQFLGGFCCDTSYGGGGGGGWYGGDGGGYLEPNTMSGGGGGSGYIVPSSVIAHIGTPTMTTGNTGPNSTNATPHVGPPNPANQGAGGAQGSAGNPGFVRITINDPLNVGNTSVTTEFTYNGADQTLSLPSAGL